LNPSTVPHAKLCLPDTGSLLYRERSLERLDRQAGRALVVISAPPGYGKTSLVCSWLQQRRLAHAWLSLDACDNVPSRFWQAFCQSFAAIDPGPAEQIEPLLMQSRKLDCLALVDSLSFLVTLLMVAIPLLAGINSISANALATGAGIFLALWLHKWLYGRLLRKGLRSSG